MNSLSTKYKQNKTKTGQFFLVLFVLFIKTQDSVRVIFNSHFCIFKKVVGQFLGLYTRADNSLYESTILSVTVLFNLFAFLSVSYCFYSTNWSVQSFILSTRHSSRSLCQSVITFTLSISRWSHCSHPQYHYVIAIIHSINQFLLQFTLLVCHVHFTLSFCHCSHLLCKSIIARCHWLHQPITVDIHSISQSL